MKCFCRNVNLAFQGFYTYLYGGSIVFMCYVFFYVLKVKVKGPDPSDKMEMEDFIEKMARAAGIELQHAETRPGNTFS